jgi:hypothetical protein
VTDGNWRYAVAAIGAALICLAILCAAFLAGLGGLVMAYGEFLLRFGDVGIIGMIPIGLLVALGPGALWYALTLIILRLLGESD